MDLDTQLQVIANHLGTEVIQLRRVAAQLNSKAEIDAALDALAQGKSSVAGARLRRLDEVLALRPIDPQSSLVVWSRARILAITEGLTQHASYFEAGALA